MNFTQITQSLALRARERDAVEEFKEYVQDERAKGSREQY